MEDCIFCKIVKGEIPSFKVYEDDKVLAFEDINPIAEGHTLIIPKRHAQNLWEIPGEDLIAIHMASQKVGQAINEAVNPVGIALLQLNGRGVNQLVMHYHLHLVPRPSEESPELELFEFDETVEKKQVARLRKLKRERDDEKVRRILDEVRQVARSDEGLMPVFVDAVKAYATVGEISDALRDVFGEYREASTL